MIFRFASPWILLAAVPVLAACWYLARRRRRGDARLVLPGAGDRLRLGRSAWVRIERILPWVRAVALLLVVLALARPQAGATQETVSSLGVDIVIALDVSHSMMAEDFQPLNRLAVAKNTVSGFVEGRSSDRIGLVVFASLASTRCPLTLDHMMLQDLLDKVEFAAEDETGTAIGMGLATAVNRLRDSDARSRVVVLLTDGRNNQGEIGPEAAAKAAAATGVRVYTIGVGTDGEVPITVRTPYGVRRVHQRFDLDEDLLQRLADETDGRYFRATDPEALRATFETIDGLEKSEIESHVRIHYAELFPRFLLPAALLLLLEWGLGVTRLRRIP